MRVCFFTSLFLALLPLAASAQDTVTVGGEKKRAFGTPIQFANGDISCVITLKDDRGATFTEAADFELCAQEKSLKGKRVALTYKASRVQAASCQGDPNCKKSDLVALIVAAKPAPLAAAPPAATPAPSPSPAGQASFCTPAETVVFSCRSGAKMVSVCASKDAGPNKGYVQYRFGKPDSRDPLELVVPENQLPPPRVAAGESVPFSGGGGAWMRFPKGQLTYTVYTGIGKWGPRGEIREKAGLVVAQSGKQIAVLKCNNPKAVSELGPDWFEKAGVKSGGQDFEFPD
ncbi:MAG: hypothetical protein PSV46_25565 [Reyranella sp.]|nr:hypothetical protein [Reyranella sp.]